MDNACQTPLSCAARSGHAMIVTALVPKGALVDSPDRRGGTPLSYATEQGHRVVVRQLLAAGAQVGMRDKIGESPMEWAKCRGRGEIWMKLMLVRFNTKLCLQWPQIY